MDAAIESFRVQRPFLAELTAFSKDFSGATAGAARRAAGHQPGARDRHARPDARCPRSTSELEDTFDALHDLTSAPSTNAAHPRAHRDGHHAQPAAALLRPVRDRLQRAELLLHLPRRALLRARQHRPGAARAAQLRRPAGRLARLDGRRRAGQRPGGQAGQHAVPARRPVRRGDHARRARRLRGRPARLPRAQRALLRQELQDRPGRAHARAPRARPTRAAPRVPKGQTYTSTPETGPYSTMAPSSSGER